jgi:lipopolysaccharide transport system ATP-binding protein
LKSQILVADEVIAVGDTKFQQKCLGKMEDVSKNEGRTVIFVSHNLDAIAQLCNTCALLEHGKLVEKQDNVKAVIKRYRKLIES